MSSNRVEQLYPLPPSTPLHGSPAKITVIGTVSSVQPANGSIILDVEQPIIGSSTQTHLGCYGRLNRSLCQHGQLSHLPMPNTVITYTGDLFGIDDEVLLVSIDSTVYMPRPKKLPLAALPLNYRRYKPLNLVR